MSVAGAGGAVGSGTAAAGATARVRLRDVLLSRKMLAILLLAGASGFPNQITESALQAWLKDVGATKIEVPDEAKKKLE